MHNCGKSPTIRDRATSVFSSGIIGSLAGRFQRAQTRIPRDGCLFAFSPNYIRDVPKMKKHDSHGQAGTENEIEITPEMVEAGVEALRKEFSESARYMADASASDVLLIVKSVLEAGNCSVKLDEVFVQKLTR